MTLHPSHSAAADLLAGDDAAAVRNAPLQAASRATHDRNADDYDNLLRLAAELAGCPMSLLIVAERGQLRLAAQHGFRPLVPREHAILRAVDYATPLLVLPDAAADPRFRDDPIVGGAQGLRFYAGVALFDPAGLQLGVLAIADREPHAQVCTQRLAMLRRLATIAARMVAAATRPGPGREADPARSGFGAMLLLDGRGGVMSMNAAARELFAAELGTGTSIHDVVQPVLQDDPDGTVAWLCGVDADEAGEASSRTLRFRRDGQLRAVEALRCLLPGSPGAMALALRDVTGELQRGAERADERLDALTQIPSRGALLAQLGQVLAQGKAPVMAVLGLDDFRTVNDALGPAIGDSVLQIIAGRLLARMPADALLARIGGDEFGLLFPDGAGCDIDATLEAVLRDVSRPCEIDHHRVDLEASLGATRHEVVASASGIAFADAGELLARAGLALRAAKHAGGHRIRWFEPGMRTQAMDRRQLDLELRRACLEDQFELHYQPQVDLATGCTTGAEALLRWRHPERGLLLPAAFIDALANSVVAPAVGRWILQRACRDAASWPEVECHRLAVSVNLFPVQLDDVNLLDEVDSALAASRLDPALLELELTETIALRRDSMAEHLISELRSRGVRVSFDDFGTGFASLSMLRRLPVDRVKIDHSFVRNVIDNRGDEAIVRSIALMARNFDLDVIAEGVETPSQARFLRELGCDEVQGFLYSEALPSRDFLRWLEHNACAQAKERLHG